MIVISTRRIRVTCLSIHAWGAVHTKMTGSPFCSFCTASTHTQSTNGAWYAATGLLSSVRLGREKPDVIYCTSWMTPASGFALDVAVWNSTRKMFSDIACVRFEIGSLCPLHVSPVMQSFSPACTVKSTALAASGSRIPRNPANAGLHETAGSSP